MYTILAKLNKLVLPSFTKQQLDPAKAKKMAISDPSLALLCNFKSIRQKLNTSKSLLFSEVSSKIKN